MLTHQLHSSDHFSLSIVLYHQHAGTLHESSYNNCYYSTIWFYDNFDVSSLILVSTIFLFAWRLVLTHYVFNVLLRDAALPHSLPCMRGIALRFSRWGTRFLSNAALLRLFLPDFICHLLLYCSTCLRTRLLLSPLQRLPSCLASPSHRKVMNLANSAPPAVCLATRVYNLVDS